MVCMLLAREALYSYSSDRRLNALHAQNGVPSVLSPLVATFPSCSQPAAAAVRLPLLHSAVVPVTRQRKILVDDFSWSVFPPLLSVGEFGRDGKVLKMAPTGRREKKTACARPIPGRRRNFPTDLVFPTTSGQRHRNFHYFLRSGSIQRNRRRKNFPLATFFFLPDWLPLPAGWHIHTHTLENNNNNNLGKRGDCDEVFGKRPHALSCSRRTELNAKETGRNSRTNQNS